METHKFIKTERQSSDFNNVITTHQKCSVLDYDVRQSEIEAESGKHIEIETKECNLDNFVADTDTPISPFQETESQLDEVVTCGLCNVAFDCLKLLKKHIKDNHVDGFDHGLCLKGLDSSLKHETKDLHYIATETRDGFEHKMSESAEGTVYVCSFCDFQSKCEDILIKHAECTHPNMKVEKKNVDESTHSNDSVKKEVVCANSKLSSVDSSARVVSKREPFKCKFCGYVAKRKTYLKIHVMRHNAEKPFKCKYCEYSAVQKADVTRHLHSHNKKKPFNCSICDYGAVQKAHLRLHIMRNHTKEVSFSCDLCDYGTVRKSDLIRHMMHKHSKRKLLKCKLCDYTAVQKLQLSQHVMSKHGKDKPFKCDFCSYSAVRKLHMSIHIVHKHNKQKR